MPRFLLTLACLWIPTIAKAEHDPPNILLILADDLGWADLGFQGSQDIQSPHLDQIASESVRFTDGHVTASVCSPSRAGLLTGRYQQRFGHEANTPPNDQGMDVDQTTLADALKQVGYRTGLIGKWHLGNQDQFYPTQRGFDYFYGLREGSRSYFYDAKANDKPGSHKSIEHNGQQVAFDGYLTDVLGEKAVDFVGQESDDPFFLFLSFTAPHGPMHATEADLKRFAHIDNKKRRTYAAMIWAMDRAIGKVMQQLKDSGEDENTIVWFLSDNGGATGNGSINLPLAGHKGIKFEGGIRVPFLIRWKKQFPSARSYDSMVSSMDIFATSLAAAKNAGSDTIQSGSVDGVNLIPYLTHETADVPHKTMYWHKLWFSAMRDESWKLIHVQGYGDALYNLADDPGESTNLAAKHPERLATMRKQLDQWKASMEEPRWGEGDQWFRVHSKNHIRIIEGR